MHSSGMVNSMVLIAVTGDHDRPEWLITINGMFEGSTGSREVSERSAYDAGRR